MVEQVDVADPDRKLPDLSGVFPGSGREVGLPAQSVDLGGLQQACHEVIGNARRGLGLPVEVDPERLGLDEARLCGRRCGPASRTTGWTLRNTSDADAACPENSIGRIMSTIVRRTIHSGWVSLCPHLAKVVLADVHDVTHGGVHPQTGRSGRRRRAAAATDGRTRPGAGRAPASAPWPDRCRWRYLP